MKDYAATPEGALMISCALGALMLALILWRTSMSARARASAKARAWAEIKRPEWEERASRKRQARASGAHQKARIRGALMSAVALVALAATNLSAHGTILAIRRAGLDSLDAAISVIVVFEMFLAILGALSYWHMHHGEGFNRYEVGVWLMASLMGALAWWGAGAAIYALWPLLAAIAWHLVITFGREGEGPWLARWWSARFGVGFKGAADARYAERLHSKRARHGIAANIGPKLLRPMRAHLYRRAQMRAQELGIYGPDERASEQLRAAVYYVGARALAPEAVARMNPWAEERASVSAYRVPRTPRIPVERASEDERASVSAPEEREPAAVVSAPVSAQDAVALIAEAMRANTKNPTPAVVVEWTVEFYKANGELPTRVQLAEFAHKSHGHASKWLAPARKALGL